MLSGCLNKKYKIKEFYKEIPQVQKLIDEKLKDWMDQKQDLIDILSAVNKSEIDIK
jgi:hypothetical protein